MMKDRASCGVLRALCAAGVALFSLESAFAKVCTFSDGTWDAAPSDAADEIVIVSGDLTWDGSLPQTVASWTQTGGTVTFKTGRNGRAKTTDYVAYGETDPSGDKWFVVTGDVSIQSGTWTHPVQPAFNNTDAACADGRGIWRLLVKVGGSMQIGESAKIDVTANGFLKGTGPGCSTSSDYGASHGGRGTAYSSNTCSSRCPRDCYGSVKFPRTLGSGGNTSSGGGSVELVVTGALTLDGAIRADGNDYNYGTTTVQTYHAPAGGSVFVTAGSLVGRGFISADGATCTSGGCGGGGRVAVKLMGAGATFETFSKDRVSAAGKWSGGTTSFCGPLYFETPADDGEGELVVRGTDATMAQVDYSINYVLSTQLKDPTDDYTFSRIVLSNSAVLGFESNVVVRAKALVSENATVNTNQLAFKGGQLLLGGDAAVSNVRVRLHRPGFPFAFAAGGSKATTFGPETYVDARVPVEFPGDLTLARGTRVVQPVNGSKFNYRVDISVAGDLTVEEGAIIDATACGYSSNVGHGPDNLGLGTDNSYGGSHGGLSRGIGTAVCYGSITEPDEPGAGCRSTGGVQLNGGGVVRLRVTGATRVDGRIAADGKSHTYMGGAGGSVFLRTDSISGSGRISADGGSSSSGGWYPGGGGRVAVCLSAANADFSSGPAVTAYGGKVGTTFAGAGTVYLETAAEGAGGGRLVVDASNALVKNATVQQTVIGSEVTGDQVGSVVVANAAKLYLDSGRTLSVSGDWLNSATFASAPGGTVRFVGSGAARICGVNDFANLTCTEPGKTLRFGTDGSRLNIISGGTLTLSGDETSALVLDREGETGLWPLALAPGSSMALTFLDVSNSDARFGAVEAFATDSTGRDNEGWTIVGRIEPGATITWTGVASDSWTLKDNWDLGRLPVATDRLVIGPSENPPCLSGDVTAGRLTVLSGATLYLAGSALSVTDGLACAGTMVFAGTERLQVAGDVNLGGATFTGKPSVVDYVCDGTRTANFGDMSLGKVTIAGAGTLAVTGGFSASDFTLSAAEALKLSVSPGVTVATTDFHADGGDAVALRLWGEEGPWTLGVSRLAVAVGVSVSNCVASGSRDITADAPSQDCGGNVRWRFPAGGIAVWTGGASGSYEDPDGWSGKTVPGADAHVQIPAGSAVTAAGRVTMRQLTLGGSLACAEGFEVAESAVVQAGGVLSSDRPSSVGVLLMLQSGAKLTHSDNAKTEVNKLELTVGGDMIVEAGAYIDVTGMGCSSGGPGVGIGSVSAGSYGGRGACWVPNRENEIKHCYGSVFAPVNVGSSAYYSKASAGGGAVRIEVGGTLQLDGVIEADGAHLLTEYYSGSGGSIYLRAAAIVGAGGMSANGGTFTTDCGGAGGRIALYQTVATDFSGLTGAVEAHGGHKTDSSGTLYGVQGAAGTIYRQSAGDRPGAGTITVNAWDASIGSRNQYTELPVIGVGGDDKRAYREATVSLERKGVLGLTGDLTVGELELPAGTELRLYGHRLRVRSMRHVDGRGWEGTVTLGGGSIVWGDNGLMLFVR